MGLFDFIKLGGPINWILFGLLCFCLCHWIERIIYFCETAFGKKRLLKKFATKVEDSKNMDKDQRRNFLEKESALVYFEMNRGLWFMNFIGSIAPSIGLLGTIVGLISAFQNLTGVSNSMNIEDLAGGIWVALLTTAMGMIVSIPSMLFYRVFKRIIEKRMLKINILIEENC